MRQRHDPGMILVGHRREVADVRGQGTGVNRRHHRRFVDNAGAGEVQDDGALAHEPDPLRIDQAPGGIDQRHVNGHHVGTREQVVETDRLLHAGRKLPGALHGDLRVVTQDLHAKQVRRVTDFDPDRTETDDSQRLARQFGTHEALLACLGRLFDRFVVAGKPANELPGLADVSCRQQQPGDHQFLHRIGIGARRVEDRDSPARQLGNRDVVGTGPRPGNGQHSRRNLHRMHVRRTQQDGVRVPDLGGDLVTVTRQPLQAANRYVVEGQYPECHPRMPLSRTVARTRP